MPHDLDPLHHAINQALGWLSQVRAIPNTYDVIPRSPLRHTEIWSFKLFRPTCIAKPIKRLQNDVQVGPQPGRSRRHSQSADKLNYKFQTKPMSIPKTIYIYAESDRKHSELPAPSWFHFRPRRLRCRWSPHSQAQWSVGGTALQWSPHHGR